MRRLSLSVHLPALLSPSPASLLPHHVSRFLFLFLLPFPFPPTLTQKKESQSQAQSHRRRWLVAVFIIVIVIVIVIAVAPKEAIPLLLGAPPPDDGALRIQTLDGGHGGASVRSRLWRRDQPLMLTAPPPARRRCWRRRGARPCRPPATAADATGVVSTPAALSIWSVTFFMLRLCCLADAAATRSSASRGAGSGRGWRARSRRGSPWA